MKRTRPHPNRSTLLSNDPQDKRCACLNHAWTAGAYALAPDYFDACARRWSKLNPEQMKAAEDMISFNDRPDAVEQIAPYLPAAPKFPTEALDKWPHRILTFAYPRK